MTGLSHDDEFPAPHWESEWSATPSWEPPIPRPGAPLARVFDLPLSPLMVALCGRDAAAAGRAAANSCGVAAAAAAKRTSRRSRSRAGSVRSGPSAGPCSARPLSAAGGKSGRPGRPGTSRNAPPGRDTRPGPSTDRCGRTGAPVLPDQGGHDLDVVRAVPDSDPPHCPGVTVPGQTGPGHHLTGDVRPLLIGEPPVRGRRADRAMPHRLIWRVAAVADWLLYQSGQLSKVPIAAKANRRFQPVPAGRSPGARALSQAQQRVTSSWRSLVICGPDVAG